MVFGTCYQFAMLSVLLYKFLILSAVLVGASYVQTVLTADGSIEAVVTETSISSPLKSTESIFSHHSESLHIK